MDTEAREVHPPNAPNPIQVTESGITTEARDVQLIHDFGEYYMVRGENLRAGDDVIVSGKGLFDGKVVAD